NRFSCWPYFGRDEIRAVNRVLRSGKVNQWTGEEVFNFEKEYAQYLGVKHAVALANGSVALDIALLVLGIGPGDEVIVPCRSFVASASCVALRNAIPVFADIDRDSQNITVEAVEKVFTKRTKAVLAVHLAGWPCELSALRNFCNRKGIFLIEDCAQAHGAEYQGKPVGSLGDVSCFSFCQDKIITTGGEGGLLATNNKKIWEKAWSLKDHGRNYQAMFNKKHSRGFVWAVESFGTNYRMTEMQAAIGRIMLAKLNSWVDKRRKLAEILNQGFAKLSPLRVTIPPAEARHAYYKYYVFVKPKELKSGWDRDRIIHTLNKKGIPCGFGSCPEIYREKAFRKLFQSVSRAAQKRLPIARELGETSLMFRVHPTLTEEDMRFVVREMGKILA
ncbi:MAG: DegT/DnrJ/EryC1/StrS aminotransferase family protein, partial [Candidatus Omnitrophota bacterium]